MQRIFVTGATGFVGHAVVRALLAHGFLVRCLVRPGSEALLKGFESIDRVPGDVLAPDGLSPSVEGCAAVIHLVGIIREQRASGVTFDRLHTEATANMLGVARQAGVKRFIQMSAVGTRSGAVSRYHRTKWQAEEVVRASELDWTIIRSSLIFGPGDEFISVLARMIRRLPAVPVLGDGQYQIQPVAVEQIAEGFARALRLPMTVGQTYEVGGPQPYRVVDLLDQIGLALGVARVRKLHIPLGLIKTMTRVFGWVPFFPVTMDQIIMLEEGNVTDPSRFYADFNMTPEPLAVGLKRMFQTA
jgi:NADH dehydrogenase